ncbi:MAG: DUF5117 domain-containing protein [Vicinamibacterales bacterium]
MLTRCALFIGAMTIAVATTGTLHAQQQQRPGAMPSIDDRTEGLRKIDGYFPLYWDERSGSMFLEISRFDADFLFATGLSAGLGSNDIGLDRGQGGGGRIVQFERVGPRVLLVQPNQSFRSSSPNVLERKSVEDSFAKSVLWGFAVVAESGGRVLVDASDFFLRDLHGAAGALRPGTYRVDRTRSAFFLPGTKGFPKNTEIDVTLTFVNEAGGGVVAAAGRRKAPRRSARRARAKAAASAEAVSSRAASPASPRPPTRSRCASTPRSSSCPTNSSSRGSTTRAPVTAG